MCIFWQAGAETVENITFGERSLEKKVGEAQRHVLGAIGFSGRFKALLVQPLLSLWKKRMATVNLTNNNIYIYIVFNYYYYYYNYYYCYYCYCWYYYLSYYCY